MSMECPFVWQAGCQLCLRDERRCRRRTHQAMKLAAESAPFAASQPIARDGLQLHMRADATVRAAGQVDEVRIAVSANTETAILAGGCFWPAQELLRHRDGVISTRVG